MGTFWFDYCNAIAAQTERFRQGWLTLPGVAWLNRHPRWAAVAEVVVRLGLAWVWLSSGWAKFQQFDDFQRSVYDYHLVPVPVATVLSFILPPVELLVGGYILLGLFIRQAALASVGMLMVFMVAIGWAMALGLDINCGCLIGGQNEPVGWKKLAENTVLLLASLWLWAPSTGVWRLDTVMGQPAPSGIDSD